MRKIFANSYRVFLVAAVCFASFGDVLAQDKKSSEPMVIGGSVGVDGAYCESAKADFDLIAQVANEKESNVIVIARLGRDEGARSINRLRLSQLRDWLLNVRGYSPDRIVTAEGERLRGLGQVEVYVSGKPFIIYRMRRNKDFFRGNYGC
jgi:hypothetical protein